MLTKFRAAFAIRLAKTLAALGTKAHWVEVLKRAAVTFGTVFTAQLALGEAHIISVSSARVVVVSSAAFAANVVFRTIVIPEANRVKTQIVPLIINDPSAPKSPTA